ncbi:hypothetical protein [Trueperella bernardiae]|uniref:hypothetical protein n=1 Tax=Trueperella bernardiae TaxID=59561 RepID=UPI002043E006|nr:hypothetical protein [Trueperella bernardiae]MCM3906486.1 hypothetical protein [Trueperella bernardiae]
MKNEPRWRIWLIAFAVVVGFGVGLSPDLTDWKAYAQAMVDARNAAIVGENWEVLWALTVDGSPARAEDEQLKAWMEDNGVRVEAVVTEVISVNMRASDGPVLEVISYQSGAHIEGSDSANESQRICRRWAIRNAKIYRVRPCLMESG